MAKRTPLLDEQLCFVLYAASRLIIKEYQPALQKLELTYPQYLVLLVLWEKERCTVKELGQKLYLDSGTLTPLLKRMQSNGLVERTRSEADERVVELSLTQKGQDLKGLAHEVPGSILEKFADSELDWPALREQLKELITTLRE